MSRFMLIAGILLAAVGVATAMLIMASPGQMQVYSLTLDVAAILLIGGFLGAGLGGVIAAIEHHGSMGAGAFQPELPEGESTDVGAPSAAIPEFGRRATEHAAAATTAEAAPSGGSDFADTIAALEKAKKDITNALGDDEGPEPAAATSSAGEADGQAATETAEASADVTDEADLYVVEERVIRGRPARVLSDGTVEAETDEGWMRFENLEHLDEYLDAMTPGERT